MIMFDRLLRFPGYLIGVLLMLVITLVLAVLLFLSAVYAGIMAVVSYTVTFFRSAPDRQSPFESLETSARMLARRWRKS